MTATPCSPSTANETSAAFNLARGNACRYNTRSCLNWAFAPVARKRIQQSKRPMRVKANVQICVLRWALAGLCVVGYVDEATRAVAQRLTLHEAVEQAMNSPQLRAAAAQVDEARGQLRQAGLGLNPRLFLQSEDFRPWASDYDFATQTENYAFVSQTFELDGKRHRRTDVATARVQEARANEQIMRARIAGRVAAAYWNAVVLDGTTLLLNEDMKAVDEMVRYHRERVEAGAMRGVDLLRMEMERDRLRIALRTAERDAEQARLELAKEMGRTPDTSLQLSDVLDHLPAVPAKSIDMILTERADVMAAREAVTAAQADVRLQRANGVPDLDLIGGYKRNSANNTGYASVQIPLPFRNRNQGEIERAQASVHSAQENLAALELRVRADVVESEKNYAREQDLVANLLPDLRQKAKQNLDLMTEAYRIGGVDLLRFLDAERTEFDVEVSALRMMADLQQAAVRLQLSYGVQP